MEYSRENLASQLLELGVPKSKLHRYVNFPLTVQLFRQGVPIAKVYQIVKCRKAARHLILQGLDWKTVKRLTHRKDARAFVLKGSKLSSHAKTPVLLANSKNQLLMPERS